MSSPIDTGDWSLSAYMDWKPAKEREDCSCGGKGVIGGHFKDMEGPRTCPDCHGMGTKVFYPKTKKPEIPKELIEHLRNAWIKYWEVGSLFKEDDE